MLRHQRVVMMTIATGALLLSTIAEARRSGWRHGVAQRNRAASRNSSLQSQVGHKTPRARPRQRFQWYKIAQTPMPRSHWLAVDKAVRERNPRQKVRILKDVGFRSDVIAEILTWGRSKLQTFNYEQKNIAQGAIKGWQKHRARYISDHKYRYRCEQYKKMGGTEQQFSQLHPFMQMNLGGGVSVGASTNVNTGRTRIERTGGANGVNAVNGMSGWLQGGSSQSFKDLLR